MVRVSFERGDSNAVAVWKYIFKLLDRIGHNGMSDEEDDEMLLQGDDGKLRKTLVKKILRSIWRHPYFQDLFAFIDKLPEVESLIFRLSGVRRIPRIRVDQVSKREAPPGLPRSFYWDEYLEGKPSFIQVKELKISDEKFDLLQIKFSG